MHVCVRAGGMVCWTYICMYVQIYVYPRVRAYAPTHLGLGGGHVGVVGVRAREVVLELVGRHIARLLVPYLGGWVVWLGNGRSNQYTSASASTDSRQGGSGSWFRVVTTQANVCKCIIAYPRITACPLVAYRRRSPCSCCGRSARGRAWAAPGWPPCPRPARCRRPVDVVRGVCKRDSALLRINLIRSTYPCTALPVCTLSEPSL